MAFPDFPPPSRNSNDPFAQQQQMQSYRFTRDELRVLKECNQESFYTRCLPLMTSLGLGAYYGVHLGYLKPNAKYAAAPKVMLGVAAGFIIGKISYKEKCEAKILALPGGKLKESLLAAKNKKNSLTSNYNDGGVYNEASLSYAMPYVSNTFRPDEGRSISELDTDRPIDSFDNSFRTKLDDDDVEKLPPLPIQSHNLSYEDLRKKNRDEFDNNRRRYRSGPLDDHTPYSYGAFTPAPAGRDDFRAPGQPMSAPPVADSRQSFTAQPKIAPQRKNLYGDIIEK